MKRTLILLVLSTILFGCDSRKCLKGHYGVVHHSEWTQWIVTSYKPFIMIPVFHPAYDAKEYICDEYEKKAP